MRFYIFVLLSINEETISWQVVDNQAIFQYIKGMDSINRKLIRKTQKFAYLLQLLPFIRLVILNGSLAQLEAREGSDIDLLIIAKHGRIFTVRFLVNLFGIVSLQKRPRDENKNHFGKFCFNYFMSDSFLKIGVAPGRAEYCRQNYSKSIRVFGDKKLFDRFLRENKLPGAGDKKLKGIFPVQVNILFRWKGHLLEFLLSGLIGDKVEETLRRIQVAKIMADPITNKYKEYIVYNENELRFHPPKF
ncbi:MAG: nucleotidyltransferase domain-containing protein [Patescibacteria group bacterium]